MSYNFFTMKNLTQIDFTQKTHTMQLKMKFDMETYINQDSKVQLVCNLIKEINLSSLLSTYSKMGRKKASQLRIKEEKEISRGYRKEREHSLS